MIKKLCDCPCNGPFCNSLIHPCLVPHKHRSQADEDIYQISKQAREKERLRIKRLLAKQGLYPDLD
jgi:hypothetical protein